MIYDNYLYNKQIKLTFEEIKHTYFYEGKKVPSVTSILSIVNKPALINLLQEFLMTSFCRFDGIIPIFAIAPTTGNATRAILINPATLTLSKTNFLKTWRWLRFRLSCSSFPIHLS